MDSALVVIEGKYVCAACGGTGVVAPGANVADEEPDTEVREAFRVLWNERPSMKEFVKLAKEARKRRPRLVE